MWKTFRDHRNHHSENCDPLITISPESVIIFPGILITIIPELRSRSPGTADHHPPESPGWSPDSSHRSEIGTPSTKCLLRMATFSSGV
jgi:hypothetical protein